MTNLSNLSKNHPKVKGRPELYKDVLEFFCLICHMFILLAHLLTKLVKWERCLEDNFPNLI